MDFDVEDVSTVGQSSVSNISSRTERLRRWGANRVRGATDASIGAAAVFSGKQRVILLAGFALTLILRLPQAWLYGRFLGEEGTIFMAFAWHRPASLALWQSFAGYLNLGANASTLVMVELVRAGLLPLAQAPRFTMTIALLFQLIPAILILTGHGRWLANRWTVIGCLLAIAISPMTEEVFANVLHIQFHLALAAALILALDIPVSRFARVAYWAPLVLAPLCGPSAIVILPLFALRTLTDRDGARLTQTLALAAGAAAQMLLFYSRSPLRGHLLDPATLVNLLFVRLVALPYASAPNANLMGYGVYTLYLKGGLGWWLMTGLSLAYFGWLARTALRGGLDAAFWLILSGLLIAVVTFGAGMLPIDPSHWFSVGAAERYDFLPLSLLSVGLIALVMRGDERYRRICMSLIGLMIMSGASTFFFPVNDLRSGPDWQSEVAAWQDNHDHMLATWPAKWLVDLSDHDRPCSPPSLTSVAVADPTYCESSWQALVVRDSKKTAWSNANPPKD